LSQRRSRTTGLRGGFNRQTAFSGIFVVLLAWVSAAAGADLTTAFMNCTYLLQSHGQYGTAIVIGEPTGGDDDRAHLVMVTAAHVLESIPSEKAVLHARIKSGGAWRKIPWPLVIRRNGRALWTRHPAVDLAALRVALPEGSNTMVPTIDLIATDLDYQRFDIQPGEPVMVLGFPLAMGSNDAGFPILRGGRVASYPLTPQRYQKTFFVDVPIFPGNSGGPVLLVSTGRMLPDGSRAGRVQMLLGMVAGEVLSAETEGAQPAAALGRPLSLARVVHATFIHDLIARLPPP
jgi:hypothetical protein